MAPAEQDILVPLHVSLRRKEAVPWVSVGSLQQDLVQAYGIRLTEDQLLPWLCIHPSRTLPPLPADKMLTQPRWPLGSDRWLFKAIFC
jgi:hypothetical protein